MLKLVQGRRVSQNLVLIRIFNRNNMTRKEQIKFKVILKSRKTNSVKKSAKSTLDRFSESSENT